MKRVVGFILLLAGFVLLLANLSPISGFISRFLPFLLTLPKNYVLAGGAILVVLGIVFLKSTARKGKGGLDLLPIFEGKKVVGYHKVK